MTPERNEVIKRYLEMPDFDGYMIHAAPAKRAIVELWAALEEAQQHNEILRKDFMFSGSALAEAQQTIARQREALEWYADPDKHEIKRRLLGDFAPITLDKGDKARAALRNKEGEKTV